MTVISHVWVKNDKIFNQEESPSLSGHQTTFCHENTRKSIKIIFSVYTKSDLYNINLGTHHRLGTDQ